MTSVHLQDIIERQHQITNAQVVFLDVESYSKRRTQNQIAVVEAFTSALKAALTATSQAYIEYAQANNVNFKTDIIRLPTGDGAAIGFTFDGLHDIHVVFAGHMLHEAEMQRSQEECGRFMDEGWCNCHPYYNLTIGISEGKAIVYKDVNGGYNLAGGVVNMAARVMGLMSRNQVGLTDGAYEQMVDLSSDPNMGDSFRAFRDIRVKHNVSVNIHQWTDPKVKGLNVEPPEELSAKVEVDEIMDRLRASPFGFPLPPRDVEAKPADVVAMFKGLEAMTLLMSQAVSGIAETAHATPASEREAERTPPAEPESE